MLPPPAPVIRSARPGHPKHSLSLSDGKPVAPSSIFAQVRPNPRVASDAKAETDESTVEARRNESYHMLTTVSDGEVPRRIRSQIHPIRDPSKAKQEVKPQPTHPELINGPGPTIITEDVDSKPRGTRPTHIDVDNVRYQPPPHRAVPPSPGEISLSSFPIPVSSPPRRESSVRQRTDSTEPAVSNGQEHQHHTSHPSYQGSNAGGSGSGSGSGSGLRRQSSQHSHASSASAFSIPFHMIPDRSSSVRDRSVLEESA